MSERNNIINVFSSNILNCWLHCINRQRWYDTWEAIRNTCLYGPVLSSSPCHHLHIHGVGGAGVKESMRREADPFLLQVSVEASCRWADSIATEAHVEHKALHHLRNQAQSTDDKFGDMSGCHAPWRLFAQGMCWSAPEAARIYTDLSPQTSAWHCFSHIDT